MDMDKRMNRNCYACGSFGYIAKNCRNWEAGMNRWMEVDQNNNLKEEWDLIIFDQIPVIIGLQCLQEQIIYLIAT